MNTKFIVLMTLLIMATCDTTVNKSDQCSACTQFKSSGDCTGYGCTWTAATNTTAGSCAKSVVTTYTAYCPGLLKPETTCASTFGCAYVDSKCLNFAGCSAYVKTTTAECQAISTDCISDGTVCTDALDCSKYTATQCASTPDLNGRKCTLDSTTNVCRNYNCSEADATYTTDDACIAYSASCVTTGAGCVTSPLPQCSSLTGTDTTCLLMKGSDGKCKFGSGTNCTLKQCTDAPTSTATDTDCGTFISGCVTTGKGCISTLGSCSSYTVANPATDCTGYVGTDGVCEGDSGQTTCRPRKCENGTGTTDALCDTYKKGCVTTGKACISSRGACSSYTGTISTCSGYIGSDGNCKGTNATTAGACAPKVCDTDSNSTYTTDTQCKAIQSSCLTTGAGCVSSLSSCTTYPSTATDGSDCLTRVGSEGKCKAGTGGKCAPKVCTDAPTTTTTNTACNTFKTGCVTNGAGCIAQSSCINTVAQTTCIGTTENSALCNWNPICVDNTTCNYATQALCASQKAVSGSTSTPCIWDTTCRYARCADFTGTLYQTDSACAAALTGCVTNGTGCVSPSSCSNFKGVQATCLGFKASCTNLSSVTDANTVCISRACTDSVTYTIDSDCINYLSSCLTNGNGCISNTALCSAYSGTQSQCDLFYGYDNGTIKGTRCWNTSTTTASACTVKQCTDATSMTQDQDCITFLTGCVYDGNGSCISKSSSCSAFTGNSTGACENFKGNNGSTPCWWVSGTNCTAKACNQNTTASDNATCGTFLTGCLTNGAGCVSPSTSCSGYSGTQSTCVNFTGNSIQCTKLENCAVKQCGDMTTATSNADCVSYHSNCRLKQGTQTCYDAQTSCTLYTTFASGATDSVKLAYCNVLTLKGSTTLCGYDSTAPTTCSARTCALWSSTLTTETCPNYVSVNGCRLSTGNSNLCYAPVSACAYNIPSTITAAGEKLTWCNNMSDNSATPLQCTYSAAQVCSAITTCEAIVSPINAAGCNLYLKDGTCQFANSKCITTQNSCTLYSLANVSTGQSAYCSALKASASGVITPCKYDSGTTGNCVPKTVADITSPTSQASCDAVFPGQTTYYSGACYKIVACTSYTIPSSITSAAAKQLFCQNMIATGSTDFCSYDATLNSNAGGCAATVATCADYSTLPTGTEVAFCNAARISSGQMCTRSGTDTACSDPSDICALITTGATSDAICDQQTTPQACTASSGACVKRTVTCATASNTGTDDATRLVACQALLDGAGNYCSFTAGQTTCAASKATCADWSGLSGDQSTFCSARIDQNGTVCAFDQGANTCRDKLDCESVATPQSQADCDFASTGCTYSYSNRKCYVKNAACSAYLAVGADDATKKTYCKGLFNTTPTQCTLINGATTCTEIITACTYAVTSGDGFAINLAKCQALGCTYYQGATCIAVAGCGSYTGGTETNCPSLVDTAGLICLAGASSSGNCVVATCATVPSPTSQADCNKYVTGCTYYGSACYASAACNAYVAPGTGTATFCSTVKDSTTSQLCIVNSAGTGCQARSCTDVSYPTHAQCQAYLSTCKSNGTSCIDVTTNPCTSLTGIPSLCSWFLDIDGISTCTNAAASTTPGACTNKTCAQNVVATTNDACGSYLTGCLTTGKGCIASTALCNAYYGTQDVCSGFTGSDGPCWGAATFGPCRLRVCADDTSSTTDDKCKAHLSTCLTKGTGCISKYSACSGYNGTQDTCKGFTGSDGKCWNTTSATATTACTSRTCTAYTGKTDSDCDGFIPAAANATVKNCVTNGTNCVPGTTSCSGFKGTYLTCPNFTALDGPCKATSYSATAAACTPKVCTEAPNNLNTDALCKAYHPTCVTTGRGCVATTSCSYIQSSTACSARTGCVWANQCRAAPSACSSLTSYGQSICTNTLLNDGVSKCAWSGTTCRPFQCTDFDATNTTHAACQALSTSTMQCTTSGAGCVPYSTCDTYLTPSICVAANTTQASIRCGWDDATAKCRQRLCADNTTATTDTDCNTFLAGCKTQGTGCVGPSFGCSVFTSQKLCLINGNGYPCVWVGGYCYDYADCTDATSSSLTGCQNYNSLCVPSSTTCIAQTSCDKYTEVQSCTVGIGSTVCGWLPTGKCQVFGACSDAAGTSNSDCFNYSSTCITDGTNCVATGTCSSYLTQTACGNAGTDGQCTWVASSNQCRLAICTDKTATTDSDCLAYIVSAGKCTTDGTTCVARAACTGYTTQAACTIGSDGIPCIYTYPVGQTTGTQSCRAKECSDITGTTNDQCIGQIANKACVSNGKACVKQDTCANYKNKLSCNGGGSDGVCAFTPAATTTDALAGTCQLFTSCDKANNDSVACNTKSSACQWTSTVSGTTTTTSCTAKTCVQAASGTTCNYIPSFDGTKYTICNLVNNVCTASDPSTLAQANCYTKSAYTYTWNDSTSKCVSCTGSSSTTNNTTNSTNSSNNSNTTTTNGYILGVTIPLAILGLFA